MSGTPCSPGSHPHADRPNWRPAETLEDYLRNVEEGLEQYSERRYAALMGVSRMRLYRSKLIGEIPKDLFERLLRGGARSLKSLANVALALRSGNGFAEIQTCPHCGGVVRVRPRANDCAVQIVNDWIDEGEMIRNQ